MSIKYSVKLILITCIGPDADSEEIPIDDVDELEELEEVDAENKIEKS